jgi:hypothetical protein
MSIRGMTPSSIGETGPPVVGRADAEAVALAVGLAVAVALMLADAVGLAVAVALMLADALLLADALDIALGLDAAEADALGLDVAEADALGLDIMLLIIAEADALGLIIAEAEALGLDIMLLPIICELLIICPLGIMCIPFICCAIATAAKANTATMHRAANKRNFLKMPPSVDFLSPGSTCTFPSGGHVRQITKPPSMYVSRLPNTRCSVDKSFAKQYVGVECGTLRLVLDQEGVRADAATGVPHLADTDSGTRAAAKRTKALRDVSSGTQEAI